MRILLNSYVFSPSTGGIETVSLILAQEFQKRNHEVVVVTKTAAQKKDAWPFMVVRDPSPQRLMQLTRWSEVVFHNNISLNMAWPLVVVRRPWVVAHHTWIPRGRTRAGIAGWCKRRVMKYARGIAICQAIADDIGLPATIIPNPYDDQVFRKIPTAIQDKDLVFVGRLVSDKGAADLLAALALLRQRKLNPNLTVIGDGPEMQPLKAQSQALGLENHVSFVGSLGGESLAAQLNRHRIMVVPSRWNEPFGVVALEGIACGCVVVGTSGGGLPEAIGPCGVTYPNKDSQKLAQSLECLLTNPQRLEYFRAGVQKHLAHHTRTAVAEAYLKCIDTAVNAQTGKVKAT